MLRGDAGRALLLVPETGLGHGAFEVCEANPESLRVKGTHGPRRAGSRSPRADAPRANGRPWEWMVAGGRPEPIGRCRGAGYSIPTAISQPRSPTAASERAFGSGRVTTTIRPPSTVRYTSPVSAKTTWVTVDVPGSRALSSGGVRPTLPPPGAED